MEYNDYINPVDDNVFDLTEREKQNLLDEAKGIDRGYNKIYREVEDDKGRIKRTKIDFYTTNLSPGSTIRDAETGEYYPHRVGSLDEEMYFIVTMATGDCKSKNGSNKLYYLTPDNFMNHLQEEVPQEIINTWTAKRNYRKNIIDTTRRPRVAVVVK
jgi:hypothetical protein